MLTQIRYVVSYRFGTHLNGLILQLKRVRRDNADPAAAQKRVRQHRSDGNNIRCTQDEVTIDDLYNGGDRVKFGVRAVKHETAYNTK